MGVQYELRLAVGIDNTKYDDDEGLRFITDSDRGSASLPGGIASGPLDGASVRRLRIGDRLMS